MAKKNNVIVKGTNVPIEYTFVFGGQFAVFGLNNFTDIVFLIGDEQYDLTSGKVAITSATTLSVNISNDTQVAEGEYSPTVLGVNTTYPEGYPLVHEGFVPYMKVWVYDKI